MKTLIIILLLISNVLVFLLSKRPIEFDGEDFTLEEKELMHECLLNDYRRKLLFRQDARMIRRLIAKWETFTGLDTPEEFSID